MSKIPERVNARLSNGVDNAAGHTSLSRYGINDKFNEGGYKYTTPGMSTAFSENMSSLSSVGFDDDHEDFGKGDDLDEDFNIQGIISERFDALIDKEIENANRKLGMSGEETSKGLENNFPNPSFPELGSARKLYLRIGSPSGAKEAQKSRPTLSPDYDQRASSPKLANNSISQQYLNQAGSSLNRVAARTYSLHPDVPQRLSDSALTASKTGTRVDLDSRSSEMQSNTVVMNTGGQSNGSAMIATSHMIFDNQPQQSQNLTQSHSQSRQFDGDSLEDSQINPNVVKRRTSLSENPYLTRSVNFAFEKRDAGQVLQTKQRSQSVTAPVPIPSNCRRQLGLPRARSPLINEAESISSIDFSRDSIKSKSPNSGTASILLPLNVNVDSRDRGSLSPSSMYSNAPDLAGLAHPGVKRSRLNLQDQGPAIVPSVVDLARPVQHLSLNHLPQESNSKAVINALRTLQDKVAALELEKQNAKGKIIDLEKDLVQTRHMLINEQARSIDIQRSPTSTLPDTTRVRHSDIDSPVITASEIQRRQLEDQVKHLESELQMTRQALEREHRIAEVSQEAQEIASELMREAEAKARKAEKKLTIKEKQMRDEMQAVCEELGADVKAIEEDIWENAYESARARLQAEKPPAITEGIQTETDFTSSKAETNSIPTQYPSALDLNSSFVHVANVGVDTITNQIPTDTKRFSVGVQMPNSRIPSFSEKGDSRLQKETGISVRMSATELGSNRVSESGVSRQSDPKLRQSRPSIRDDPKGRLYSPELMVDEKSKSISKEEIESQLSYLRNRALNLERQLEQSRDQHHSAMVERDLARQELSKLQERIRKRERKLKRFNQIQDSPRLRRSRSPSPTRSSPRRLSPRRYSMRDDESEQHIRSPRNAWIVDEVASQLLTTDIDDTGAEADVEESHVHLSKAQADSFGFLNERDISQIRDEIGKAQEQASNFPIQTASQPTVTSEWPIWKDAKARSFGRNREILSTFDRRRKSDGRSRSPKQRGKGEGRGREMPFIVGTFSIETAQNAGKSYSVTANLQKVFSLLKSHNPSLCGVCNKRGQNFRYDSIKADDLTEQSDQDDSYCALHSLGGELLEDQERRDNLRSILAYLEKEFRSLRSTYNDLVIKYESVARDSSLFSQSDGRSRSRRGQRLRDIGDDLKEVIQDMNVKVIFSRSDFAWCFKESYIILNIMMNRANKSL
ncbi:hypothetical protein HDU67_006757 [Dinochytrium kinnereticum]|nr:hypothetical protein HDU67_006757 [Dinochytrium kinnereticum]